jgi:hypothetical protein
LGAKRHKFSILGAEALKSYLFWTVPQGPALRCKSCGIAILDYARIRETPKSFLKKCVECDESIPIATEYCPKCGTYQKEKKECARVVLGLVDFFFFVLKNV